MHSKTNKILKIDKILIANRSEIACRIIRTCKKLNIKSVAIYTESEKNALHTLIADESYMIKSKKGYLDQDEIIKIAKETNSKAIHPGYGFLSENSKFAEKVLEHNIKFIGPSPSVLSSVGNKDNAKKIAIKVSVPTIPGYHENEQTIKTLKKEAKKIGFPLLIKAAAGGGGRGIRLVEDISTLEEHVKTCKREGLSFFNSDKIILEKLLPNARHIEVQLFGDSHGNIFHLFERDCSVQRRKQKLIEESSKSSLSKNLQNKIFSAAEKIGKAIKLDNAATVEFLVSDDDFYFLEINPRIQVEHPVTEMIAGLDLIKLQILSSSGSSLKHIEQNRKRNGAAIELRVNAEIPEKEFLPSTGKIKRFQFKDSKSVRFDHAIKAGTKISPEFDSLIVKIIAHADTRKNCIELLANTLDETSIFGIDTNIPFLKKIICSEEFAENNYTTNSLDLKWISFLKNDDINDNISELAKLAPVLFHARPILKKIKNNTLLRPLNQKNNKRIDLFFPKLKFSVESNLIGSAEVEFSLLETKERSIIAFIDNKKTEISLCKNNSIKIDGKNYFFHSTSSLKAHLIDDDRKFALINGYQFVFAQDFTDISEKTKKQLNDNTIISPIPGKILKIIVDEKKSISKGETLIVIESMKIEHEISSTIDGLVEKIFAKENQQIEKNQPLVKILPREENSKQLS